MLLLLRFDQADERDVLNFDWLVECDRNQCIIEPRHEHFWHMCSETKEKTKQLVDRFGDYYTSDITAERYVGCLSH
jgi:hypothetical protein